MHFCVLTENSANENKMSNRISSYGADRQFSNRWSPRSFTSDTISEETVMTLLEAAHWAPSSRNLQPWRFVYGLRETIEWEGIVDSLVEKNKEWAQHASALIVIISRKTSLYKDEERENAKHAFDTGAAWMSLALQAEKLGLRVHAMGGFDDEILRKNINLSDTFDIHCVVAVGTQGKKEDLSTDMQSSEESSNRMELSSLASKGKATFE